jgi:hypothetical protein
MSFDIGGEDAAGSPMRWRFDGIEMFGNML